MTVLDQCRVTVRTRGGGTEAAVDLAIPAWLELAEILPRVVALVAERTGIDVGERWMLAGIDGSPLDESMTLTDNGVRDGDVLLLTTEMPAVPQLRAVSWYVAEASPPQQRSVSRRLGSVAGLWSVGLGAAVLAVPGPTAAGSRATVAAVAALSAAVAAVLCNRVEADALPTLSLGTGAIVMGAVAGYLMVPGGPAPPNFFLAAVVAATLSMLLLHSTSRGISLWVAVVAVCTVVAISTAVVSVWPAPTAAVGAAITAASLAMLGLAAKLAIVLTGLAPRIPDPGDGYDPEMVPAAVGGARAARTQDTATGLLAGFSSSAALGTVLVAANHADWRGVGLTGAVSAVLLFRAAEQRGTIRTTALFTAGIISATATVALGAVLAPQSSSWLSLIAITLGVGGAWVTRTDLGSRLSPFARRGLEIVDYVALAAVVPLACWVVGVFGLVRGLSLS